MQYFGPFQVSAVIGKVAYKLKLPSEAKIHNVFHVSQLMAFKGTLPMAVHIPTVFQGQTADRMTIQPVAILDRKIVKAQNGAQVQYLVQWLGFPTHEATWEIAEQFEAKLPEFISQP